MGTLTPHGLYKPDVGEVGWGPPVDRNFDLLDPVLVGGGGGGATSTRILKATDAPFGADNTGATFCDTALDAVHDAAFNAGPGSTVYLPAGIYKVKNQIAQAVVNGIAVRGDGMGLTTILIGNDVGGPLWPCLGRHGYPTGTSASDWSFSDFTVDGNNRLFKADAWGGWWQSEDATWQRIKVVNLLGSAFFQVACRRSSLTTVRVINCGYGAGGAPAVAMIYSDEAGVVARQSEYLSMTDVSVIGSDDMAVYWSMVYRGTMTGCRLQGSGDSRPVFQGIDLTGCVIAGNAVTDGNEDNIILRSRGPGRSSNNVVVGNNCYGENQGGWAYPVYGVHEASFNAQQTHVANQIGFNVGTVHRA